MNQVTKIFLYLFILIIIGLMSNISLCAEFRFKCPENISTDEGRKKNLKDFNDDCIKNHPNWTIDDLTKYRVKLLKKHKCKKNIENISQSSSQKTETSGEISTTSGCLKSEPANVILSGKLERRTYPGPPNYENIKEGDKPETGFYLLLKNPVCYIGDELSDPSQNVSIVQLVLDKKGYDKLRPYLGKIIKLKGNLFGSHTGHHHAPILLENTVLIRK
jgi:hypothetical protein